MHVAYSSDELKSLVRILNDILAQARASRPDLATDDVVERVFSLADRGERDPQKLRQAVFGAPVNATSRQASSRDSGDYGLLAKGDGQSAGLVRRPRKPTLVPSELRSFPVAV